MHAGNYAGQVAGQGRGLNSGLLKGNLRGTVANNRGTKAGLLLGVIGDSTADGAAILKGSCPTKTFYNFIGSSWSQITTQSVANDSPTLGSIWHYFANAYKAEFNKPTYLVSGAKGGSSFYTSTFSWYTTGTLYTDWLLRMNRACASLGKKAPDLIVMKLGVNDIRAGFSYANITAGIDSLVSRITSSFPNTPVLVMQIGRTETDINSLALADIREYLIDTCNANANFHMVTSPPTMALLSGYEADGLHENAYAQKIYGKQLVNWLTNSRFSKWGRSIISTQFDVPSNQDKIAMDTYVLAQVTSGNYLRMDGWHVWKNTVVENMYFDWTFMGYASLRTASWAYKDAVTFNGSTYADLAFVSSFHARRSTQNNFIAGVKIKTRSNTTASYAFGSFDGAKGIGVLQQVSANPIRCLANNGTFLNGTDVLFAAGHFYASGRTGTTQKIYKDATAQATASQASTGVHNFPISVGGINSSGTRATFTTGSVEYCVVSEHDSFDLTGFYNDSETYIAAI